MKQAVFKRGGGHFDIVRQAETALDIPRGDALVNVLANLVFVPLFTADRKRAFLHFDGKIVWPKPATAIEIR